MRSNFIIFGLLFLSKALMAYGPEGTNGAYNLNLDVTIEKLRLPNLASGNTSTHYMLVKDPTNGWVRQIGTLDSYLSGYASLSGSYSNPSWITSLDWSKITGAPSFLTSETDPLFDTKFSSKTTDNLVEGSINKYFTDARSRGSISLTTNSTGAASYNSSTGVLNIPTPISYTAGTGISILSGVITNTAPDQTVTITAGTGIVVTGSYPNFTVSLAPKTINNNPGRTLVTTAAAANGFQISSTKDAEVSYSVDINTSVSLSGNSSGYVVLEICPTNSAVAANWIEVSRVTSGQSGTLVVGLVLNQVGGAATPATVPAGYYARIRSVNVSGTPTYNVRGQQEVY